MKQSEKDYVERLIFYHQEKDAIKYLKSFIDDEEALFFLIDIYLNLGNFSDAIKILNSNIIQLEKCNLFMTITFQRDLYIKMNKVEEIQKLYNKYRDYPYHSQAVEELVNDLGRLYEEMIDEILHKNERIALKEQQILDKLSNFVYDLEIDYLIHSSNQNKNTFKKYLKSFKEYLLQDEDIVNSLIKNIIVIELYRRNFIEDEIDYFDGSSVIAITKKYLDNINDFVALTIKEIQSYHDNITFIEVSKGLIEDVINTVIPYNIKDLYLSPRILAASLLNLSAKYFLSDELNNIASFYNLKPHIVEEKSILIEKYLEKFKGVLIDE